MRTKFFRVLKIIVIILLSSALLTCIVYEGGILYVKSKLSKIHTVSITNDPSKLGINGKLFSSKNIDKNSKEKNSKDRNSKDRNSKDKNASEQKVISSEGITNILLIGTDTRDPKLSLGYADSIMILTFDKRHKKIKLTSVMRDSYVSIDGHGKQKLSTSHKIGGPLLTIKTVNENFDMNIQDYVKVNFWGFEKIVDYLGGVQVNITKEEIPVANNYVTRISKLNHKKPTYIQKPGLQNLNGMQALGYSRIRYVGRADFQRTDRQRTILNSLLNKLRHSSPTKVPGVLETLAPNIETSVSTNRIIGYVQYALLHGMTELTQNRIPYDGLYKDVTLINSKERNEVLDYNKAQTVKKLHKFIYQ